MQRNDRWPEDYDPDGTKSRPTSRRNSASLSRRSSTKKEKEGKKKSPLNTTPNSVTSTPKKVVSKPQNLEFVVTGKQCLKKCDRANSLPGYNRRPAGDAKTKKLFESPKRTANASQSSKSRETSLEDDMSLDLSQVSDFEDTNSKYGIKAKFSALATSTPKVQKTKPRSGSLQSHLKDVRKPRFERDSTFLCSRDSVFKSSSSASPYRYGLTATEPDYSSVSPEYSGQSSADMSPRVGDATPRSIEPHLSSCCGSSWQDCSEMEHTAVDRHSGEWSDFWAHYNNSTTRVPMKSYYDQCPTPYRTENIDLADLEFSADGSRKRSPDNMDNINSVIRNEGLHLTPRETQNIIKCAHILGNVLSKAIERRCKEKDDVAERIKEVNTEVNIDEPETPDEMDSKKKTLTLDLKETNEPAVVEEEKRCETVTTQTDISLPNTKSAPRIFEKILRQLSKSSLEEGIKAMNVSVSENETEATAVENKEEKDEKNEIQKEN